MPITELAKEALHPMHGYGGGPEVQQMSAQDLPEAQTMKIQEQRAKAQQMLQEQQVQQLLQEPPLSPTGTVAIGKAKEKAEAQASAQPSTASSTATKADGGDRQGNEVQGQEPAAWAKPLIDFWNFIRP